MARALLFQANLPIKFWGESVLAATYLINRTLSIVLDKKTPYEILFGTPPDYDHLRTFGSLCFARRISRDRDKFSERSVRCIFIGYPVGKKGWLVYDLDHEKSFASRDVIFHEDQFPFVATTPASEITQPVPLPQAIYEDVPVFPSPVTPQPDTGEVQSRNTDVPPPDTEVQ